MMPNTDMKQSALSSLYGIDNAGTGYQNPAPALLIVIIFFYFWTKSHYFGFFLFPVIFSTSRTYTSVLEIAAGLK